MADTPNEEGLRALGQAIDRSEGRRTSASRGRRGRPRKRWKKIVLILSIVLFCLVGAIGGYLYHLANEVHHIDVKNLSATTTKGAEANTENILLVGSTSRCALAKQTVAYGLCTQGVNGVNSDVTMILHLDPNTKTVSLLSIPRDLFIPNARKEGANKIDAALYEGPSQLVAAIGEDLGIPIQHYIELNFDTFANVVNALGGITMYFPEPVFDAYSGLNVSTPGCHHLNGYQALQVVRARHLQYKSASVTTTNPRLWPQEYQSDLARIRRDHEFLRVLASSVSKKGLTSPTTDLSLVNAVAPNLTVDKGLSARALTSLVLTYRHINITGAPELTLPVSVAQFAGYDYKGDTYGDIEFPAQPQDRQIVDQFLGIKTSSATMTGSALPAPSTIRVSVVNGSGVAGQADLTSQDLSMLGFTVVGTADATPVATHAETVISYDRFNPKSVAKAEQVARAFDGGVILAKGTTVPGADVTVTTGTEFSMNLDAYKVPAKTRKGHPTTTTTTTTIVTSPSNPFAAPTSPSTTLAPWDPRACTVRTTSTTTSTTTAK